MNTLVGVVLSTSAKDYCIDKFTEMAKVVFADVDVIFAVDHQGRVPFEEICVPELSSGPCHWATWSVYWGKKALGEYAMDHGYDRLVWQGIDCFYETKEEFNRLLIHQEALRADIFGAVVAGRNREDYPVCRQYNYNHVEGRWKIHEAEELPPEWFDGQLKVCPGYIGSDATVISSRALHTVTMDGYQHWHEHQKGFGPEEYFMWSAIARHNMFPVVHTGIRPWHAHETGRTVRYPDGICDLNDLHWN